MISENTDSDRSLWSGHMLNTDSGYFIEWMVERNCHRDITENVLN